MYSILGQGFPFILPGHLLWGYLGIRPGALGTVSLLSFRVTAFITTSLVHYFLHMPFTKKETKKPATCMPCQHATLFIITHGSRRLVALLQLSRNLTDGLVMALLLRNVLGMASSHTCVFY